MEDRMIDDILVADAVVHGFNWTSQNYAIPEAAGIAQGAYQSHRAISRPETMLTADEFTRDWQAQDLEELLFLESGVDFLAYHGTPIFDFWRDGHSHTSKGLTLRERNPGRVIVYGACNPFEGESAVRELERLVSEDGITAIKMYAARYHAGRTYPQPVNDPEFGYPFIERALDLGVRVIAVHKALPFGPVRSKPFGMDDLPEACARYPEMNFEVVHAGFAFLEDTAFLASFPNVWLNLENSAAYLVHAPRRFAEMLGLFLSRGAGERIMFASGAPLFHPAALIAAIRNFQIPDDLVEDYGYPVLTDELTRMILGENFLRLHAIDPVALRAEIADDEWARRRNEELPVKPWSGVRSRLATG
jgi:uncharacterized protein